MVSLEQLLAEAKHQDTPIESFNHQALTVANYLDISVEDLFFEYCRDESAERTPVLPRYVHTFDGEELSLQQERQFRNRIALSQGAHADIPLDISLYTRTALDDEQASRLQRAYLTLMPLTYANFQAHRRECINATTKLPNETSLKAYFQDWKRRHDPLYIREHPEEEQSEPQATLITADANLLGKVNKQYGTDVGDRLLYRIANTCVNYLKRQELRGGVWHLHGDEFSIFIEGINGTETPQFVAGLEEQFEHADLSAQHLQTKKLVDLPVSVATGYAHAALSDRYETVKKAAEAHMAPRKLELGRQHMHLFLEERHSQPS
jgi:GGDEF domain-containing protein